MLFLQELVKKRGNPGISWDQSSVHVAHPQEGSEFFLVRRLSRLFQRSYCSLSDPQFAWLDHVSQIEDGNSEHAAIIELDCDARTGRAVEYLVKVRVMDFNFL